MKPYPHSRHTFYRIPGVSLKEVLRRLKELECSPDEFRARDEFAYLLGKVLWECTQPILSEGVSDKGGCGESWTRWKVYSAGTPDIDIAHDFDLNVEWAESAYDCSGRPFTYQATVTRGRTRVLVKQTTALDI